MHAYLLITNEKASEISPNTAIGTSFEESRYVEISTIEQVRNLKKSFLFSPTKKTAVVISGIEQAKHEAQNAILKLLEEPPSDMITFLLVTPHEDALIPTILSRVTILTHRDEKNSGVKDQNAFTGEPKSWFLQLSKITDRDDAIDALNHISLMDTLTTKQQEAALQALSALKKNGSVQLHLTNFLLRAYS